MTEVRATSCGGVAGAAETHRTKCQHRRPLRHARCFYALLSRSECEAQLTSSLLARGPVRLAGRPQRHPQSRTTSAVRAMPPPCLTQTESRRQGAGRSPVSSQRQRRGARQGRCGPAGDGTGWGGTGSARSRGASATSPTCATQSTGTAGQCLPRCDLQRARSTPIWRGRKSRLWRDDADRRSARTSCSLAFIL